MIQVRVSIEGGNEAIKALGLFRDFVGRELEMFIKREGALMEKELKQNLSVSANVGKGPKGGDLWEASAPGEPPRARHHYLQGAQSHKVVVNKSTGDFILDVGGIGGSAKRVNYQRMLEYGTSKLAARPHLMPVIMAHIDKWPRGLKTVVDESGEKAKQK